MDSFELNRKDNIQLRLKKIAGQVKGIQRMIDEEKYCVDILIQIAAVRAALDKVGLIILENHSRECLRQAMENGKQEEMVSELIEVLKKFIK
jgi:DNA-binding FrmR family transcriptional regulator